MGFSDNNRGDKLSCLCPLEEQSGVFRRLSKKQVPGHLQEIRQISLLIGPTWQLFRRAGDIIQSPS